MKTLIKSIKRTIRNPMRTQEDIQEFVTKQLRKHGKAATVYVTEDFGAFLKIWVDQDKRFYYEIHIGEPIIEIMTSTEIMAIIAHEMGHIFHDPKLNTWAKEHFADMKSLELGATAGSLISALKKCHLFGNVKLSFDGEHHPSVYKRARYIGAKLK